MTLRATACVLTKVADPALRIIQLHFIFLDQPACTASKCTLMHVRQNDLQHLFMLQRAKNIDYLLLSIVYMQKWHYYVLIHATIIYLFTIFTCTNSATISLIAKALHTYIFNITCLIIYAVILLITNPNKVEMAAVKTALIQMLIKMVSPSSPAYGNSVPFIKSSSDQQLINTLKPGDIIFSRTNSVIYQATRKLLSLEYDHVAVVLSPKEVIHISPPIVSKLGIENIVNLSREPLIIRPSVQDIETFLTIMHNFLGQNYNTAAIPKIILRELSARMNKPSDKEFSISSLKYSRICTDAVLYALCRASPSLNERVHSEMQNSSFKTHGYVLPDELIRILTKNSAIIYKHPVNHPKTYSNSFVEKFDQFVSVGFKLVKTVPDLTKILGKSKSALDLFIPFGFKQILRPIALIVALAEALNLTISLQKKCLIGLVMLLLMFNMPQKTLEEFAKL